MDIGAWLERLAAKLAAAALAGIITLIGEWTPAMTALVILMVLDFAAGWIRAFAQRELSSKEALWGTTKKAASIAIVLILAWQVDVVVAGEGAQAWFRNAVLLFYIGAEGLSILENVVALGLPVPGWLHDALRQLNERKYVTPGTNGRNAR